MVWKAVSSPEGNVYYYNVVTDESSWEHPMDAHYKELAMSERAKKAKAAAS